MRLGADEALAVHLERARVARDLHDGLAQNLAFLLMKAELCRDLASSASPDLAAELDLLAGGVQAAIRETWAAIFSLHDAASNRLRFLDALREVVADHEAKAGQVVALTWAGDADPDLAPAERTALLRVAQEALTNIRKHASATRVAVHLDAGGPKTVELSVQDDGCGFDAGHPSNGYEHFGILGMRARMEALSGGLRIESGAGCGTTLVAVLPAARPGANGRG